MRLALGLLLVLAGAGGAMAADDLSLAGSVRGGWWSSNRRLDDSDGRWVQSLWLDGTWRVTQDVSLVADGHAWAESRDSDRPGGLVGRDAYVRLERGALDVRLGLQSFAWGRADRVNPTDVMSRRDYTLLTPAAEDQRLGLPAVSVDWATDGNTRLLAVLQSFRPSISPTIDTDSTLPQVADRTDRPEVALRLDHVGDGMDWSLVAARVYDKQRWLVAVPQGDGTLGAMREHPLQQVWGGDWAATLEDYSLRAEAAYAHVLDGRPSRDGGKSSNLFGILGVDRNFGQDASYNANIQYLFRWNRDYDDAANSFAIANGQTAGFQQAVSVRLARQPFDAALTWEWVAMFEPGDGGVLLQPLVSWRLDDSVILKLGGELYRGDARRSMLGSLRSNSLAFAELRWVF